MCTFEYQDAGRLAASGDRALLPFVWSRVASPSASRIAIPGALTRGLLVSSNPPAEWLPLEVNASRERPAQQPGQPLISAGSGLRLVASKGRSARAVSSCSCSLPAVRQIPCRSKTVAGAQPCAMGFRGIKPFVSSLRSPLTFLFHDPLLRSAPRLHFFHGMGLTRRQAEKDKPCHEETQTIPAGSSSRQAV